MDHRRRAGLRTSGWRILAVLLCFLTANALAEPLPLKRAVALALSHGTLVGIGEADVQHAFAAYRESRNGYIPQLIFGSGLGKSWGFPLTLEGSAPSIFNVNTQSALYNPSLKQFMKAAHSEAQAATLQNKDRRDQVIQDTVLSYVELNMWEQRIVRLRDEEGAAMKLEEAMAERVKEGVDSPIERTKTRLAAARVRLRVAEAEGSADVLRQHLSQVTGLPASSIETIANSMPAFPVVNQDADEVALAEKNSPLVQSAEERARAQYLRAQGEHKALLPSVDFAGQYARLSTYNNYDAFYKKFEANNATVGVAIRLPVFNPSQRARASAADADAIRAKREAEGARNQVSEQTLKQQRAVRQLEAAQEVAQLEFEVAQANLDALQTRVDAGTASLRDVGDARTQATERFISVQDTALELQRTHVVLLRSTGELENWINGAN